jgi:NAD(P)-dependent dehydrogenase (short-subunit alcohol dehydrogenase family)
MWYAGLKTIHSQKERINITQHLFSLKGRTAVITGSARGIGLTLALGLAGAGAQVVLSDINEEDLQKALEAIKSAGARAAAVSGDIVKKETLEALLDKSRHIFGSLDIWVNNAGVISHNSIVDGDDAEWERVVEINLNAVVRACRAAASVMKPAGYGRIINVGSSFSSQGSVLNRRGGGSDYCLAKSAVQSLTKLLAFELASFGINVNAVAPGIFDTPMHTRGSQAMQEKYSPLIPLGRLGQAQDLVGAVVFLASEASGYITGQTLHVNGGMIMVD